MKKNYFFLFLLIFCSCLNEEYKQLEDEKKILDSIDKKIKILEEEIKHENDSLDSLLINYDL